MKNITKAIMFLCGVVLVVMLKRMGYDMSTWQYWVLLSAYVANNIAWMVDDWKHEGGE